MSLRGLLAVVRLIRELWSVAGRPKPQPNTDEEIWPSVPVAFEFIKPSYDQVARRIDAQQDRIRATMTFATTVTFAVLTFLTGPLNKRDFTSPWLLCGLGIYLLLMVAGILAAVFAETRLVDPNNVYDTMLELSEWEFKKDAIARAGDDFTANKNTARNLGGVALVMGLLMVAEVASLLVWAIQTAPNTRLPII